MEEALGKPRVLFRRAMVTCTNFSYEKEYTELLHYFYPEDANLTMTLEEERLVVEIDDKRREKELPDIQEQEKKRILHALYTILEEITGCTNPWGMLVGVNPLNLIRRVQREYGERAQEILRNFYRISEKKLHFSMEMIALQDTWSRDFQGGYSIYADIPFCPSRCSYCAYPTYSSTDERLALYTETLIREIHAVKELLQGEPKTVYVGGGTPSAVGVDHLRNILIALKETFGSSQEWTVEIGRPDTITKELLIMVRDLGVNRISINPQTMHDRTLALLGRAHSVADVIESYHLAQKLGFTDINMDLIMGLPGESPKDFEMSLNQCIALSPSALSIHALSLKKGSKLREDSKHRDDAKHFADIREKTMQKAGYIPYYLYRQKHMALPLENIGYVKPGYKGLYNIAMMEDMTSIIGLGLGASTKILSEKIHRQMNFRRLSDYLAKMEENVSAKSHILRTKGIN